MSSETDKPEARPPWVCPRCFKNMQLVSLHYRITGEAYRCDWPCEDAKTEDQAAANRRRYVIGPLLDKAAK